MVIYRIVIIFFSLSVNFVFSQDMHFSQSDNLLLFYNPATAGMLNGDLRSIICYRNQWASFDSPFRTYYAGSDMVVRRKEATKNYWGTGLMIYDFSAGDFKAGIQQAQLSFSGIVIPAENHHLSGGISGGYGLEGMHRGEMRWGSQYNGTSWDPYLEGENIVFQKSGFFDFTSGLMWMYSKKASTVTSNDQKMFSFGCSINHLIISKQSTYLNGSKYLYPKINFHSEIHFGLINKKGELRISAVSSLQGKHKEINSGILYRYSLSKESVYTKLIKGSFVSIGSYWRFRDSIVPTIFYEYSEWAFGISYDINVSELSKGTIGRGGSEFILRYLTDNLWGAQ